MRVSVTGSGADRVVLQRRSGRGWRSLGTVDVAGEAAEPIVRLPRGPQRLRAVAIAGGESTPGRVRTVKVLAARRWSTARRDDGTYRDRARPSVRVVVSRSGRRVKVVRADVPTLCDGDPNIATVTLPPVKIAPDGRFASEGRHRGSVVRFVGRLRRRALRSTRLAVVTGGCSGSIAVQARRTGR